MKNIIGESLTLTLFGESHGPCVGGVIDGLPPGLTVDMEYIMKEMRRRQSLPELSTARREEDIPVFLSGVLNGRTEGTPLAFTVGNRQADPSAYSSEGIARPGHADYTAQVKYCGYQDRRGGGHFSGRLTAAVVAGGAVLRQALERSGILISSRIYELGGIKDTEPDPDNIGAELAKLREMAFPVLDSDAADRMKQRIMDARACQDSVGGIVETVITGMAPGIGEPFFGSLESKLAAAVFSIGGVRGIEFGAGFASAAMTGSEANDRMTVNDGRVVTLTNNCGGINGGISNGMPIVFRTAFKPTSSIGIPQQTVDYISMRETVTETHGRHDPAIVHRGAAVIDAMTALVTADLICQRYGYMGLLRGEASSAASPAEKISQSGTVPYDGAEDCDNDSKGGL